MPVVQNVVLEVTHVCGEQEIGDDAAERVGQRRRHHDAHDRQQQPEQEHERDIHDALTQQGQQERFSALTRRLKEGDVGIGAGGEGAAYAEDAQKARARIVQVTNQILADHDAIYLPASPSTAPVVGDSSDKLSDEHIIADNYLQIGNFAGLPSITLPLMMLEGYPIGVNLTGKAFDEKNLFGIAKSVERITGLEGLDVNVRKEALL